MVLGRCIIRTQSFLGTDFINPITGLKFFHTFNKENMNQIVTTLLTNSQDKSIYQLDFQDGVTMEGKNLSKTPTLYYVKKGTFACGPKDIRIFKEGDTFSFKPNESYILVSSGDASLLEFESSLPQATYDEETKMMNEDDICKKSKLWVQCRNPPLYSVKPLKRANKSQPLPPWH